MAKYVLMFIRIRFEPGRLQLLAEWILLEYDSSRLVLTDSYISPYGRASVISEHARAFSLNHLSGSLPFIVDAIPHLGGVT